ncbi:O-antigen ligase family protein [Jiella pacifica]|uniref:O-antigen ligase n=1 Tax=Jiella pacifica TaxID=2696469 RepID=A0A6N9T2F4_9HYPH|nr:O-antigen ligase family protein [Jiella pacifica]NDW04365.1 hypothetical protein [Jiella pacifica]
MRDWATFPLMLWMALWLSINTGPWNLSGFGDGTSASINALRASFPLLALVLAGLTLGAGRRRLPRGPVEYGFWFYGLVMTLAATGAGNWFGQAYWGLAFLATLATVEKGLRSPDPLDFARRLNWLSWITTCLVLATLLFLARDVLIDDSGSAYGAITRYDPDGGLGMSRSTGLARMAAVPAIIALIFIVSRRGWQRFAAIIVLAAALAILWIMQARGAVFAFAGAMTFVLFFGPKKLQKLGFVCAGIVALMVFAGTRENGFVDFWMHITRGQGAEGFSTMSGRDVIFQNALDRWWDSPLIGYGPQADRIFPDVGNAQNALLYALLCAGMIGAAGFVVAIVAALLCMAKLNLDHRTVPFRDREMLMITSGLVVFSLLRSIPENQAAVFSIDLLIQYPAMIYLAMLAMVSSRSRRRRPARIHTERPYRIR